ncbi:putative transcriptional regulator, TetR family protein [Rhodococcoides trifolii]|uniref:Transcriptional regulator, TetR family protein n=1 Tax=Rhodococcoides trifolii TaxID=908250 RepID=A0A917LHL7_9NOCA|nr:TetR/AcrR family transcriptional regulator [Rhodococcus trifolii]GGG24207.1 putative transcriptional regulator, TetR family protein [Rhodococcus trifolii]
MARGRRPTDEVRRDILETAGGLLFETGMGGFTIDKVAALSGASKVTIYKFWPSKGALALAGYFTAVSDVLEFPDTGRVEADLRTQLHAFVGLLTETPAGEVLRELIGAAQTDAELLTAYLSSYSAPRRALAVERLDAARSRGELRENLDSESVVDQLWGACYHRLLIPDQSLNVPFVDRLVDNLFRGISA